MEIKMNLLEQARQDPEKGATPVFRSWRHLMKLSLVQAPRKGREPCKDQSSNEKEQGGVEKRADRLHVKSEDLD